MSEELESTLEKMPGLEAVTETETERAPEEIDFRKTLEIMGLPRSEAGIRRYQRDHHLKETGKWDARTQRYHSWVIALQTALNDLGESLVVTGYLSTQTRSAERSVAYREGFPLDDLYKNLKIKPEPKRS